jgi:hypothetical protein
MTAAPGFIVRAAALALLTCPILLPVAAFAAAPSPGPPISIHRSSGPITVDGDLSDAGWQGIEPIQTWFETRVADNGEPQVKSTGWLTYDDRFLYAGFKFDDPHPELIRAPFGDHDNLSGNTDYGGIILDSGNSGKTAILFLANANGLLYDAVSNDASGEDSSPDYFWDAAGKITSEGWTLEMRIPFSSLRYARDSVPTWGIMLYRNYPRDRHYQMFSVRLPRDVSCFICNESKMSGLANLPHGSHLVVAPYATAQRQDVASGDPGTPIVNGEAKADAGVDVKWSPLASAAIDLTVNPDFSQVESDASQIGVNERFAIFYPEKRSFFLEGIDLFSTPFQAVYTRSITAPKAGLRMTGRLGTTSYTALAARDDGGGSVILPGPQGSRRAPQDFQSDVAIVRARHDIGTSFIGVLATGRDLRGSAGGSNVVAGPDFEWRPRPTETIAGQALFSDTKTPTRTDLSSQWDGRTLDDRAVLARASHNDAHLDVFLQGQDVGREFRADEGFMPQVGFREGYFESGWTVRPKRSFFSRIRTFTIDYYDEDQDGHPLTRRVSAGAGMDGRWNSFLRVEVNHDDIRVGNQMFARVRPYVNATASPGKVINSLTFEAYFLDEIDFDNARKGKGTTFTGSATIRPGAHLEIAASGRERRVHVDDPVLGSGRLFVAGIARLRTTYTIDRRSFARLVGEYLQNTYEPSLYTFPVPRKEATFTGSALYAYKVNWQTVLFVGYGDDHEYTEPTAKLVPYARQAFAKVSYAWQQ